LSIAKINLAKLLVGQAELNRATAILNDIIEKMVDQKEYICSNCGNRSSDILWICPVCGLADTYFTDV